jgi:putative MATE family efflux protein
VKIMADSKKFLGTEDLKKLLWRLSIPTVTAQLINVLYNIVDRIYIGHIPETGAMALTGLGVCMPIIIIVSAFGNAVGYGGAPRASILLGRNDEKSAEKILGSCFALLLVISAVLTGVLLLANRSLLLAFGASANTIGYSLSYLNIYTLGTVFVQLTLGMNAFITAQGFARTSMLSVLIGAVSNIILDPIFIFTLHMGVAGAAWATILSQCISCIWVLQFLCSRSSYLRIRRENVRLDGSILRPCVKLGTGTFIMQISESIVTICFNSSLLKYGGDIAVGAMTILHSVMQFALLPLQGLGQGAQPIISYNYGAGNKTRVQDAFRLLIRISLIYSVTFWALIMLFPGLFCRVFTANADLVAYAVPALRVYTASLGFFGLQVACQLTFTALSDAKSSVKAAVMRKFILLIPLIYVLPLVFTKNQAMAVYLAEPVADAAAVLYTYELFKRESRIRMDAMDQPGFCAVPAEH